MNDYRQTLAALQAADLSFLASDPATKSVKAATMTARVASQPSRKRAKSTSATPPTTAASSITAAPTTMPAAPAAPAPSAKAATSTPRHMPRPFSTTEPVLPVFVPPARRAAGAGNVAVPISTSPVTAVTVDAADVVEMADAVNAPKKRNRPVREWPSIGTRLRGEYFGAVYHAEIVAARKKLKSGKQIRLLEGPAQGKRLDSYTKAALVATARQRSANKLGRKGMASGWSFWVATTDPGTPPERTACIPPANSATSPSSPAPASC